MGGNASKNLKLGRRKLSEHHKASENSSANAQKQTKECEHCNKPAI
jgi:hypothetical protein